MKGITKGLRNDDGRAYGSIRSNDFRKYIIVAELQQGEMQNDVFLEGTFKVILGEVKLIVGEIHGTFDGNIIFVRILCFGNLWSKHKDGS